MTRPLILLSNDDGYAAPGLRALLAALGEHADVVACAPEHNQSASSHALSLHRVLRLRAVETGLFAVDGTPADCVYVALHSGSRVLPRRPDLVVSGMNQGLNLGADVFYSGTVAAAREGAMRGLPAMAVSIDHGASMPEAAALGARLALTMLEHARAQPAGRASLLNVNIPSGSAWQVRATRLGARLYSEDVVYRQDPRGNEYLWIGGGAVRHDLVAGSDTEAFDAGHASITPLTIDPSCHEQQDLALSLAAAFQRPS